MFKKKYFRNYFNLTKEFKQYEQGFEPQYVAMAPDQANHQAIITLKKYNTRA